MGYDTFRVVVKGLITRPRDDRVLIGRQADSSTGGEWHLVGGDVDAGEHPEAAMRRTAREQAGLDVTVGTVVDVLSFPRGGAGTDDSDAIQVLYHCTAPRGAEAVPGDDLQTVEWVAPSDVAGRLHDDGAARVRDRRKQATFLAGLAADRPIAGAADGA